MASSVDASTNAITLPMFLAVLVKPLKLCVLPRSGVSFSAGGPALFASANKPE